MAIDLRQFHQVFFEESFEGLDVMEQGLMSLDPSHVDSDAINTIFRAAHSIKGGSATFKFHAVADFTHLLETLLDQVRNGENQLSQTMIDCLLSSVDSLREMVKAYENEESVESIDVSSLVSDLQAFIDAAHVDSQSGDRPADIDPQVDSVAATSDTQEQNQSDDEKTPVGWSIHFAPQPQILRTGNEPIRMFRELASMGDVEVLANTSLIPELHALEEDMCWIAWQITLTTNASLADIEEVFEWVADECELTIEPVFGEPCDQPAADSKPSSTEGLNNEIVANEVPNSMVRQEQDEEQRKSAPTNETEAPVVSSLPDPLNTLNQSDKNELQVPPSSEVKGKHAPNKKPVKTGSQSIRVGIDKVDSLINLVGELVITQSMLGLIGEEFQIQSLERLREGLSQLEGNTRELQESVMRIRMLPIGFVFNRFPRMVRDLSRSLAKEIDVEIFGEDTELDKTLMEQIGDPIVHLVRNSVDHGIESPEERIFAGKTREGTITLNAFHQGGNIIIEVSDDGKGIDTEKVLNKAKQKGLVPLNTELSDEDIYELLFEPGFSTADQITDVSGRGVGMDVVKSNILSLGGTIDVVSEPGEGSCFTIRLPLTLAILDGQLVRVGEEVYIVPLTSIIESLQVKKQQIISVAGQSEVFHLRDEPVQIIRLYDSFEIPCEFTDIEKATVVVVESDGIKMGIMVDELLGQQQVVIKSLETNYVGIEGIAGATILGNGKVSLILDVSGMLKRTRYKSKQRMAAIA